MKFLVRLITNNFAFKVVSLLIAVAIWYLVVYNNDPIETASYTVHVEVTNESYIANGKQQYLIDESYKTVTVYVTGNRSQLKDVSENDIEVIADLTQIVDLERDPVVVPLSVSCRGVDPSNLSLSRTTIPIVIENVASKELPVSVSTGESVVDKDYEIGVMTPEPSTVTISGPESVINRIDSVYASIDVSGMAMDRTVNGKLVFIDKDQNAISDSTIQDDITFEGGDPVVRVKVELWKKQSGVTFDVNYTGEPLEGYQITNITTTPADITVAGSTDALAKLAQNGSRISVPAELIDVSGVFSDRVYEVKLSEILPEDTKLTSNSSETLVVNLTVLPNGSIEYALDVDDIRVGNLASNLSVSYDKQEVVLRITGSDAALQTLSTTRLTGYIDLKDKTVGDYTVPILVSLPADCEMMTDAQITVHIKEGAEKETDQTSP